MKWLMSLVVSLLMLGSAQASYITYGDYTLDTETNLVTNNATGAQWLQWDETTDMSIADMIAELADGTLTINGVNYGSGWTIATTSDVATLFEDFFSSDNDYGIDMSDAELEQAFIELFGGTYDSDGWALNIDLTAAETQSDFAEDDAAIYVVEATSSDLIRSFTSGVYGNVDDVSTGIISQVVSRVTGIALVKMPEPKTLGMMIFGLCLLIFLRPRLTYRPGFSN